MLRSMIRAAAVAMLFAGPVLAETDARGAALSAALPADFEGYGRIADDMIDVGEGGGDVTVTRMLNAAGPGGAPVVIMVRLWPAEDIEDEAERMLNAEGAAGMGGRLIEVKGHPGFVWPSSLTIFPGRPGSGLAVSISGLDDIEEAVRMAGLIDYDALLAIK